MTENQLYAFRNEQTNPCDCTNQNTQIFDLEKYGPYLDKIRALFVPSLQYRVQSLLEEFVYKTNSRWANQFPCFKKFVDAIIAWKDPLNRLAEYDISTMEEMIKNIVKHVIKDNLIITCFLDSIILHQRLNKVCRELDALGIQDDIIRNSNVRNLVNEREHLLNHDCSADFNTAMNLNTFSRNEKRSIECEKAVKQLAENVYDRSTKHMHPTTSEYRERRVLDLDRNFLQQREDNSNRYSTCVATGSQNDNTNKITKALNEKSCNTESKKIQNDLKLKIIVHEICLENYEYTTFSSSKVTRLPLPCKPSNLIRRIFEADSSLTESCLIVMKRKFKNSMYNVCSCLNSVLEKLNVKLTRSLCLNCEIYPGYINFKLKANGIKKYLFVARVPICQNVRKRTIQQDFSILSSNSKSSTANNESKFSEQCKDDGTNSNDTLGRVDDKAERLDARYSQSDQSLSSLKDVTIDVSQNEPENSNERKITCMITANVSEYIQNRTIFSRNNSCKDIVEEISYATPCIDNSEERNRGEVLSSIEINCDECEHKKECRKKILESSNSIIRNGMSTQVVNDENCTCLPCENFIEASNEVEDIFSNKNFNSFSRITCTNENDWTCSSNKKSNLEDEVCSTHRCSITSFVQNSEHDKQLVELNCNRFSNNNINTIDKQFVKQENDGSLNSVKVEIGCNSCCSRRRDDFLNVTDVNGISNENIVCTFQTPQNNFNAGYSKTVQMSPRNNNLLTIAVKMPRSKILSKGINHVDTCYPQTVWLTSEDDRNASTVVETSDGYNEIANLSTHTLIISTKGDKILPDVNKEILDVKNGSKGRFRSNGTSNSYGISTRECPRAENYYSMCAISNDESIYCNRSSARTSEFVMRDRRKKFQKSMIRERACVRSRNGIRNVTTPSTIKRRTASRRYSNDYPAEVQPQTILATTKFHNTVDKSIDRIKRVIRAKLKGILFNDKISNSNEMIKTFGKNKDTFEDTRRKKRSGKCIRQGYSISSRSTCNCHRQGHTTSRESSNRILSISRMKRKKGCEENVKFCNDRLADSSEVLLSFRSIKASPWSYDLLTSTTEDVKKQKLNRNNRSRYNKKKKIESVINYRNARRLKNTGTSITISSQSTKVCLAENDSKYLKCYTCKRQGETCDDKHTCNQRSAHNQDQRENELQEYGQCGNRDKYRAESIKYSNVDSNKSLKTSLSDARRRNARNVHKQFYGTSELRNTCSRKNRQVFERDMFDCNDDSLRSKNNLRKRPVFEILTDACNNYVDDLDLDFKLRLLRYVELCKTIKRSLRKALQPEDIYEDSVSSMPNSDS